MLSLVNINLGFSGTQMQFCPDDLPDTNNSWMRAGLESGTQVHGLKVQHLND